ncbi:hypothetical protein EVAR_51998_1 [Eumeta japonica]|uniref:Uncharacterized protein n=1 Tax=Eumeta variegata TaxID=151549 RepID=A0A4C1Y3T8_EUMVA|nr:hypothetical protein EVAR_51998_1 [Eumeta japonica]
MCDETWHRRTDCKTEFIRSATCFRFKKDDTNTLRTNYRTCLVRQYAEHRQSSIDITLPTCSVRLTGWKVIEGTSSSDHQLIKFILRCGLRGHEQLHVPNVDAAYASVTLVLRSLQPTLDRRKRRDAQGLQFEIKPHGSSEVIQT